MTPRKLNPGYSGHIPGISNMILFSLLAHLFVITIVLFAVPSTVRHLTFGPVYTVALVSSSDIALSNSPSSSVLSEIERSNEAASSVIYKRQVTGLTSTPTKTEESIKVNVEKAVSAIQQKQTEKPAPTNSQANAGSRQARMTSGQMAAKINEYANAIESRVHNNWSVQPELKPRTNIETIIEIKIMRDGSLASLGFEKRSGNPYIDDSALKAVKKSAPFPPLPEWYPDNSLEIGIIFHSSQVR
jgi:colicin import membrane protein